MAKFCANCGAQLNDEDKVCGACGKPVAGAAPAGNGEAAAAKEAKAKGNGKIVALVGAAIALVVVLVIAINIIGAFTGYKGTIRKMVTALKKYDVEALAALSSSVSDEVYESWYGNDIYDKYDDKVSDVLDKYEDRVGTIKKISYEITDVTELSDRRVEEIEDNLIESYNIDVSGIKKIMTIDMTLTVKGAKKSASYSVSDLYLIKESGGWKLYYGSLNY